MAALKCFLLFSFLLSSFPLFFFSSFFFLLSSFLCTKACGKSSDPSYWYEDQYFWHIEEENTEEEHEHEQLLAKESKVIDLDATIFSLQKQRAELIGEDLEAASGLGEKAEEVTSSTPSTNQSAQVELTKTQ
jgi:hypothetical protein